MRPRSVSNTRSTPKLAAGTGGTANGHVGLSAKSKGRGRAAGGEKSHKPVGSTGGPLQDPAASADGNGKKEVSSEQHIVVGVRLRPFVAYEKEKGQAGCISIQDNHVTIAPKNLGVHAREVGFGEKVFAFDHVMDSSDPEQRDYVSQQTCYAIMCEKMVERMFEGYATCLFAYGQTGSGKTTTIMGNLQDEEEQGILVRLLRDTFAQVDALKKRVELVQCKVQMLEVYNERIQDLLAPSDRDRAEESSDVTVHMHPKFGVYAKNALEDSVDDLATCMKILEYGNSRRSVAATAVNAKSSRGHTLFKITVEMREAKHMVTSSQAFFVDLAGRENEKTTLVTGDRLVELSFINKSLMFLAQCIDALKKPAKDKGNDQRFLFRNSKLTMLLSDALSRDSRTAMIGTLSPALHNFEESLTTLNFCSTVKKIKVDAKARRGLDKDGLLKSLQDEIAGLRGEQVPKSIQQQINQMQITVDEYRQKLEEEQLKVEEAQDALKEASAKLGLVKWKHVLDKGKKSASIKNSQFPYLTNYSDEPTAMGTLVLHPEEDSTEFLIGWNDRLCDMVIPRGVGTPSMACYLWKENGRLFIKGYVDPRDSTGGATPGLLEVNGVRVGLESRELFHHDAVVIGSSLLLYAFTDESDLGGIKQLPQKLVPADPADSRLSEPTGDSRVARLLSPALGAERNLDPLQQQLAEVNLQHLQRHCRDSVGSAELIKFLQRSAGGQEKVQEANELNAELFARGMRFELFSAGPVLGLGFAESRLPELCVRLVQLGDANNNLETQMLYSWSLSDFEDLLRLMHTTQEEGSLDSGHLQIKSTNPWREYADKLHELSQREAAWADSSQRGLTAEGQTTVRERPAQQLASSIQQSDWNEADRWQRSRLEQDAAWNEAERLEKLKKENRRLRETVHKLQLQVAVEQPRDPLSPLSDRDVTLSDSGRTTGRSTSGSSSHQRSSSCPGKRRTGPSKAYMNEVSNFRRYEESTNPALMRGLFGGGHPSTYRR